MFTVSKLHTGDNVSVCFKCDNVYMCCKLDSMFIYLLQTGDHACHVLQVLSDNIC